MLSVKIMAHPNRAEWATELSKALDAEIIWDEVNHPWDTGRRALLAGTGDHVMVIQDDAVISEGLVESVSRAVEYSGDNPVGLYATEGKRTQAALRHGGSWWTGEGPSWGVAVVIPTEDVAPLVKFADHYRSHSYDQRLWHYYRGKKLCWYTIPSLVDHRTGHGSLLSKGRDRQAQVFGSGLDVDWSLPPTATDRDSLHPIIELHQGSRVLRVRLDTPHYRRAIQAGWE